MNLFKVIFINKFHYLVIIFYFTNINMCIYIYLNKINLFRTKNVSNDINFEVQYNVLIFKICINIMQFEY